MFLHTAAARRLIVLVTLGAGATLAAGASDSDQKTVDRNRHASRPHF